MNYFTSRLQVIGWLIVLIAFCLYFAILPFMPLFEYRGISNFSLGIINILSEQYTQGPTPFFFLYSSCFLLVVVSSISAIAVILFKNSMRSVCIILLAIFVLINLLIAIVLRDIPVLAIGALIPAYCIYLSSSTRKQQTG